MVSTIFSVVTILFNLKDGWHGELLFRPRFSVGVRGLPMTGPFHNFSDHRKKDASFKMR